MNAGSSTQDRLREHDFDGIREYDNRLPNWWLWTFYIMIIFSFFYWVHYHVLHTGPDQWQEYAAEVKAEEEKLASLAAKNPVTDETLLEESRNHEVVARGKKVFMTNCVSCHKADGGGLVGPNLTDRFWIHGGKPAQILHTITVGVPAKGMVAWGPVLGASRIRDVTAYLLTIRNTNVPGGKGPEGSEEK